MIYIIPEEELELVFMLLPNIETAKSYAGTIHLNGEAFLTLFLVIVIKNSIRIWNSPNASDYWVVNGSSDEIRPVSVLLTKA